MGSERYDLAVIGSGPAGQKAAIAAAKHRKRVVDIDKQLGLGGTLDYLADYVFNYPTLAEAHEVAALNGLDKL